MGGAPCGKAAPIPSRAAIVTPAISSHARELTLRREKKGATGQRCADCRPQTAPAGYRVRRILPRAERLPQGLDVFLVEVGLDGLSTEGLDRRGEVEDRGPLHQNQRRGILGEWMVRVIQISDSTRPDASQDGAAANQPTRNDGTAHAGVDTKRAVTSAGDPKRGFLVTRGCLLTRLMAPPTLLRP